MSSGTLQSSLLDCPLGRSGGARGHVLTRLCRSRACTPPLHSRPYLAPQPHNALQGRPARCGPPVEQSDGARNVDGKPGHSRTECTLSLGSVAPWQQLLAGTLQGVPGLARLHPCAGQHRSAMICCFSMGGSRGRSSPCTCQRGPIQQCLGGLSHAARPAPHRPSAATPLTVLRPAGLRPHGFDQPARPRHASAHRRGTTV